MSIDKDYLHSLWPICFIINSSLIRRCISRLISPLRVRLLSSVLRHQLTLVVLFFTYNLGCCLCFDSSRRT